MVVPVIAVVVAGAFKKLYIFVDIFFKSTKPNTPQQGMAWFLFSLHAPYWVSGFRGHAQIMQVYLHNLHFAFAEINQDERKNKKG